MPEPELFPEAGRPEATAHLPLLCPQDHLAGVTDGPGQPQEEALRSVLPLRPQPQVLPRRPCPPAPQFMPGPGG